MNKFLVVSVFALTAVFSDVRCMAQKPISYANVTYESKRFFGCYNPDCRVLSVDHETREVFLECNGEKSLLIFDTPHEAAIKCARLSSCHTLVVTVSENDLFQVWTADMQTQLCSLKLAVDPETSIKSVRFSDDCRKIIVTSHDDEETTWFVS